MTPGTHDAISLVPGEIRALAKLSAMRPLATVEITHFRDQAGVGWALYEFRERMNSTRSPWRITRYIASSTGRAWNATEDNQRIEPPVLDADYEETHR